jgi:hypothetical protein
MKYDCKLAGQVSGFFLGHGRFTTGISKTISATDICSRDKTYQLENKRTNTSAYPGRRASADFQTTANAVTCKFRRTFLEFLYYSR